MQKLKLIDYDFIFVSGTIGAGKSSLIDKLDSLYQNQCYIVKEYIDYDEFGDMKLNELIKGCQNAFDFQKYVVDCYIKQFVAADKFFENKSGQKIIICERHPIETLLFGSFKLNQKEMEYLHDYIKTMCEKLRIPLPKDCKMIEISNNQYESNCSLDNIADRVMVQKGKTKNLFCHLTVDDKVQISRLIKRDRPSDRSYLIEPNMEYLRRVNIHYQNMLIWEYDIKISTLYLFYLYDVDEGYDCIEEEPKKVKAKPFKLPSKP